MEAQQIFQVKKSGILTTFQDMGRTGYQQFGVPVSGAMDKYSLQIANILVGNARNTTCLEITWIGPEMEACAPLIIAITGADLEPKVNGKVKPMWTSFRMNKGDKLTFGEHQSGVRAYLAVAGGFQSAQFFGSQATDLNSGFGTILKDGSEIHGFPTKLKHGIGLSRTYIPTYEKSIEVAVVEGPHIDCFTNEEREAFFRTSFRVDSNSNRMGYRLRSDKVSFKSKANIWSDAVPFGGIQIPPNGQPIILMADRQTTGGYPRIGTVISSDISKIAQLVPNGGISFYPISIEKAQARIVQSEKQLQQFARFQKYM